MSDTPTPIDPADIRPGDTFRLTHEATCEQIDKRTGDIVSTHGDVFAPVTDNDTTWHLVHRPDPDAEAVEALITALAQGGPPGPAVEESVRSVRILLSDLREQGWDVVRRAEERGLAARVEHVVYPRPEALGSPSEGESA